MNKIERIFPRLTASGHVLWGYRPRVVEFQLNGQSFPRITIDAVFWGYAMGCVKHDYEGITWDSKAMERGE